MAVFDPLGVSLSDDAPTVDFRIEAAADWNDALQLIEPYLDGAGVYQERALDLTGAALTLTVKPFMDWQGAPIAVYDSRSGEIGITDAANGKFRIFVGYLTTKSLPLGEWRYTLSAVGGGSVRLLMKGKLIIDG